MICAQVSLSSLLGMPDKAFYERFPSTYKRPRPYNVTLSELSAGASSAARSASSAARAASTPLSSASGGISSRRPRSAAEGSKVPEAWHADVGDADPGDADPRRRSRGHDRRVSANALDSAVRGGPVTLSASAAVDSAPGGISDSTTAAVATANAASFETRRWRAGTIVKLPLRRRRGVLGGGET